VFLELCDRLVLKEIPKPHSSIPVSAENLVLVAFIKAHIVASIRRLELSDHLDVDIIHLAHRHRSLTHDSKKLGRGHDQLVGLEGTKFAAVVAQVRAEGLGEDGDAAVRVAWRGWGADH
jgi:hypothetical protein